MIWNLAELPWLQKVNFDWDKELEKIKNLE